MIQLIPSQFDFPSTTANVHQDLNAPPRHCSFPPPHPSARIFSRIVLFSRAHGLKNISKIFGPFAPPRQADVFERIEVDYYTFISTHEMTQKPIRRSFIRTFEILIYSLCESVYRQRISKFFHPGGHVLIIRYRVFSRATLIKVYRGDS